MSETLNGFEKSRRVPSGSASPSFSQRVRFNSLSFIYFVCVFAPPSLQVMMCDCCHGDHSPSPLRCLSLCFVSAPRSLLLLWYDESSSVSCSLFSGSDRGDVPGEVSPGTPPDPTPAPECFWFFSSLQGSTPSAAGSAWFLGLEGLEGLLLRREPSTELGLECREKEGVSGSLIRVHGAP